MLNFVTAVVGGAIGAVVAGTASVVTDVVRGKPVNWKRAGAAAAGGAVGGAIIGGTFGAGTAAAMGAAAKITTLASAGATAAATETVTDNVLHERPWHQDVARNTTIGAAGGALLGCAGQVARPLARHGGRWLTAAANRGGTLLSAGRQQAGHLARQTPALLNQGWQATRSGIGAAGNAVKGKWNGYLRLLEKYPLRTKSLTSGAIMGGGDMIAQTLEGRDSWDWKRTAFMTGFGTLWVGPTGHYWYAALGRMFPGTALRAVAGRVAVDQLVMAPFGTAVFFSATGAMKHGGDPGAIWADVRKNFWPTLKANWMVWPAVQGANFRFVPQNLQVGFGNLVSLAWTAYLSMAANAEEEPTDERPLIEAGLPGAPILPGGDPLIDALQNDPTTGGVEFAELASGGEGIGGPSAGAGVVDTLRVVR